MMIKFHHYFLLRARPWPVLASLNSFNVLFSFLIFFKFGFVNSVFTSILTLTFNALFWWFSYSGEYNIKGDISHTLEKGVKISMVLFISSEVFFFFSFFWSYFHFFCSPIIEIGSSWPPVLTESFDCIGVPIINTLILLTSGVTVTISHSYLNSGGYYKFNLYLLITIFLGASFRFLQYEEYATSFFGINDSTFGAAFFVLTGFHGIHVLIGSLFLLRSLCRNFLITSKKGRFLRFELASWYWHFVDVVWIFLYFFLYYINN